MAKTRVSVYLIKEGVKEHEEILKLDKCSNVQEIKGLGTFYSKVSQVGLPRWVENVFGDAISSEHLCSSSASAVFLVPLTLGRKKTRIFALSFGFGHALIEQGAVEERFGLKTVLNVAKEDSLRKVRRTAVASNALKSDEQLPKRSDISGFSLDVERDLLEGVTASVDREGFLSGNIAGSDSLSISAELNLENIRKMLFEAYSIYRTDAYRNSFEWVDQVSSVKSPEIVEKLNERLVRLIREKSPDVWMAVPEVVNWEAISGFRISGSQALRQDILLDDVLASLPGPISNYSQLKNCKIEMIAASGDNAVKAWASNRCLFGELSYAGKQYCLNNGSWYLIDNDFAQRINDAYEQADVSRLCFPECMGKMKESDYNKVLVKESGRSMVLLDAKNIFYGGGHSQVELCDVLSSEGEFIHIKHYSNSSVLSHLFNQGLVSARLMKSDSAFRLRAQEKLCETSPGLEMDFDADSVKEVVYGVITKEASEKPRIPFFSKVAFDSVARNLRLMGVRVSIKAIRRREEPLP